MGLQQRLVIVLLVLATASSAAAQTPRPNNEQRLAQANQLKPIEAEFASYKKFCSENRSHSICANGKAIQGEILNFKRASNKCVKGYALACEVANVHRGRIFNLVSPMQPGVIEVAPRRGFVAKTAHELSNAGRDINVGFIKGTHRINDAAIAFGHGAERFVQQIGKNPECAGHAVLPTFHTVVTSMSILKPQLVSIDVRDGPSCKAKRDGIANIADKKFPGLGPLVRKSGRCACNFVYN